MENDEIKKDQQLAKSAQQISLQKIRASHSKY